ncbi:MAG: hypothetical protein U0U70_03485 [Chitinophagaceae bacterium]
MGTTTNTFRATDAAGNRHLLSFTVTVADAQAPSSPCPPGGKEHGCRSVLCHLYPGTAGIYRQLCGDHLTWVMTGATTGSSPATGINYVPSTQFQLSGTSGTGLTIITYTIKDAAGNTATCVTTVQVNDAATPVISVPPATRFVCVGSDAVYSVAASAGTGNPLTYQWQQWNGSAWSEYCRSHHQHADDTGSNLCAEYQYIPGGADRPLFSGDLRCVLTVCEPAAGCNAVLHPSVPYAFAVAEHYGECEPVRADRFVWRRMVR